MTVSAPARLSIQLHSAVDSWRQLLKYGRRNNGTSRIIQATFLAVARAYCPSSLPHGKREAEQVRPAPVFAYTNL